MTDQPQLNAYIVALTFGDGGPLYVNAMIAPNEVFAAASVTTLLFQKLGGTDKPLMGVSVSQLMPEFLRIAQRASEGTLSPDGKNVVALVPAGPAECPHDWVDGRCSLCFKLEPCKHGALRGMCSICFPQKDRSEFPNGRVISKQEHLAMFPEPTILEKMAEEMRDLNPADFKAVHQEMRDPLWRPDDPIDPVA